MNSCKSDCANKKSKNDKKDLIIGQLKATIREMIKQIFNEMNIEEVSTTGGVAGFATPYAFGNRGKKIATTSLPGYKVTKK